VFVNDYAVLAEETGLLREAVEQYPDLVTATNQVGGWSGESRRIVTVGFNPCSSNCSLHLVLVRDRVFLLHYTVYRSLRFVQLIMESWRE